MKSRCCPWTGGGGSRPTEPHVSTAAIESQPEVWMRRDDSSLLGSTVNGGQSGNLIKLTQWPIDDQQRQSNLEPPPSTPRRSSLGSDHSSAAARVIPLTRWPLSDPRGGRRPIFDTGPRRTITPDNRYVPDPCTGRQNSDLNFTRQDHNRNSTTEVRAFKANLFSPLEDTYWSEEDSICVLKDKGTTDSVMTNMCPPAKSDSPTAPLNDTDILGVNQHPLKDVGLSKVMGLSKVCQCPASVTDLTEAHQRSPKCTDLLDEPYPKDKECSAREGHKACLQGKRGGEKCARLMSRLCHRQKRSKQHDTTL